MGNRIFAEGDYSDRLATKPTHGSLFDRSHCLRCPRDGADAVFKLSVPEMVLGAGNEKAIAYG